MQQPLAYMPKWVSNRAIMIYFAALAVVTLWFMSYAMEWYFYVFGVVEVVGFFYVSNRLTRSWARLTTKTFEKRLFWTAFGIRAVWVLFSYWFYFVMTGEHFEFSAGDVLFYDDMGRVLSENFREGNFAVYDICNKYTSGKIAFSDMGYPAYLGFVYWLTGDSLLVVRFIKAFLSAVTALIMSRLATRNFGEGVGRMTGIFCMLMPNLILYCGLHLKETEMCFLAVVAIEQADQVMRLKKFNVWKMVPMAICMLTLFTFRTVLGAVTILALLTALTITTDRVVDWGKRIIMILIAGLLLLSMVGGRLESEVRELTTHNVVEEQQKAMQWRSTRSSSAGANRFAKYAGAIVFAPMIFTLPFPSATNLPNQENQRLIHGGNFVKNIMSGFVIYSLFTLIFSGEWRKYVLTGAYYGGYLVVLAFSNFAQAERFHMPIVCFMLMFSAYGMYEVIKHPREKRLYNYWTLLMFLAFVGWNWFKLRGRGL
ncbi:MAG: hypothetical protein IJS13_05925 [Paludibacteraceae bacterium]|nr:hypothetical protein [Paludibacteraceae bacterium]